MPYFRDKHAAITGAASGIGRALAQQLHREGCVLFLSDVNESGLAATTASLRGEAPWHSAVVDVAQRHAVEDWAAAVASETTGLDLLVNNAGVAYIGDARATSYEDFHWLMNINFWGVVHGCTAFLPLLERRQRAHLVNISSLFGLISVPTQAAYNASKFAVRGYSEALRQELDLAGSSVKLCCVHPGGVATQIARSARNADASADPEAQHTAFERIARSSAESAARRILDAARRGRPRLLIGVDARWLDRLQRLFPALYPRLLRPLLPEAD
ncbi:MAG: SDR family NAD(P)-dependent oxidoreductase [Pseudomonadota bacterium]